MIMFGKGVWVSGLHFKNDLEGLNYCLEMINKNHTILIEEKIVGEEFTLMSYTDGITVKHMPLVQDFKLLKSGNKGPNTGSMGCITHSNHSMPFLLKNIELAKSVNDDVIKMVNTETNDFYKGIIYGSFIKCKNTGQIKLIEFNCRYGDPECINVLELLETNLLDIYTNIVNQTLNKIDIKFRNENIVCKYIVPDYYPKKKTSGFYEINKNWYETNKNNLICSCINLEDDVLYSNNSRTLIYFSCGDNLNKISLHINSKLSDKSLSNFYFRDDIGLEENSYLSSGVDINLANDIVSSMSPFIKKHLMKIFTIQLVIIVV